MKSTYALVLSALFALPLAAQAQSQSQYGSMSYTYADARLVAIDADNGGNEEGIRLGGSLKFQPQLYGVASITDYGNLTYLDGGVGYRHALQNDLDLVGMGGLVLATIDRGNAGDDDDIGLWLTGGVRGIATPQIEYGAYAEYRSMFSNGDLTLTGEGLLHLTRELSLVASIGLSDDFNVVTLGARWSFAR